MPAQTAVIENTGSTNTRGYRILLERMSEVAATAEVQYPGSTTDGSGDFVPLKLYDKFFKDLDAAMPLTSLPVRHGMRSASFGTQTFITYKGQRSPDLTFASDPRTAALKADVDAITKALHVANAPKRPIVIHSDR